MKEVRRDVIDAKNYYDRQFNHLTDNFYVMRSALRYFAVKKKMSFTSSKISDNFPLSTPVAGSCLKVLKELEVVQARTESSSPDRYMPQNIDMEKLNQVEEILVENREISEFSE